MKNKIHKLALFGDPVSHSLSPQIHQQFAKQFDLFIDYQLIQVYEDEFSDAVLDFFNADGLGANVTLPHKSLAITVVDKVKKNAKLALAVNTLYKNKNSLLCGDNTDGKGFVQDMIKRHGFDFKNRSVLILGAGGATQGIVPAILSQQPKQVMIANRSLDKAQQICCFENTQALDFDDLDSCEQKFDLIIHASSLGHQGKTLKFQSHHIHKQTMAYDLSYGLTAQPFIEFCQSKNIYKISNGLGMLVEQAAFSFERWFKLKPKSTSIIVEFLRDQI